MKVIISKKKRLYMQPNCEVLEIEQESMLLAASPGIKPSIKPDEYVKDDDEILVGSEDEVCTEEDNW